jgi:hypothetical protein
MKLIDILNMISKGELKEGTKVKIAGLDGYKNEYEFTNIPFELYDDKINRYDLQDSKGNYVFDEFYLSALNDDVELIEPDHFTDVGKMEKIEELEDSDVLNIPYRTIKFSMDERTIQMYFSEVVRRLKMHNDKLNEVINKVNTQTTVLLAQEKEIKEINEQLDY